MDLETLQSRYADANQGLETLDRERREIIVRLKSARMRLHSDISSTAARFYSGIANGIEGWLREYNIQKPMGLTEVFSGTARERVVAEVTEFLTDQVSTLFKDWEQSTLEPLIAEHVTIVEQELNEKMRHFAAGLEEVREELVANSALAISSEAMNQEQVSGKERALAAAGGIALGLVLGDPGLAIMGGMFGFKEMLKNILPQIAVILATSIILGPAFILPAVLGASLIRGLFKANAINKKIRDAVGKEYKQKLLETHLDLAKEIADAVDKKLMQVQDDLDQALGLELQNVRDQVQAIINEKLQGQERVNQALYTLAQADDELNRVDHEVDAFIEQLALS